MATKIEVRVYGGSNLKFLEPNGVHDPAVTVQLDSTVQSVGLPKSATSKQKNANPVWNKAFYFDTTDLVGGKLVVQVLDTNDLGQQAILGRVEIPLNMLTSVQNGVEVKHLHPIQTGGEIEIGLIPTHGVQAFGGPSPAANAPAQDEELVKRAQTVGPFALKKKQGPQKGVVQYPPQDLQRIFPHLARGTYGVVFRGKVRGSNDYVVIKDMEIQNQNSVHEWQKEIDIMARTKSPYIAEVFGFSNQGNVLTIVMEFMCNGDLFGVLHKKAEKHPLSLIQRMRMARHSALGLQVLHSKGFLHRDIKSMNILVDQDYTCKMTDFGCSKMVGEGQIFNTVNTGTPLWMAPEVKMGTYGFPSDIYSLGLVLYEIFERRLPDYDPNTQRTTVPSTFQSAPVVLPCVNLMPHGRPTIDQVIQKLEQLIRGIVSTVQKILPPEDVAAVANLKEQFLKDAVAEAHPLEPSEAEQAALYQVLQGKSMDDADGLCVKAGISVGASSAAHLQKQALSNSQNPSQPMPSYLGPNINNGEFMTPAPNPTAPQSNQPKEPVPSLTIVASETPPLVPLSDTDSEIKLVDDGQSSPRSKSQRLKEGILHAGAVPVNIVHKGAHVPGHLVHNLSKRKSGKGNLSESKQQRPPAPTPVSNLSESKKAAIKPSGDPHIIIVGATHLKPADLNGFSDPYAKVILNGIYHKTQIIKKTLDPVWDFKIPTPTDVKLVDLQIDVWDWDKIGSHDYLGYACVMQLDVTKAEDFWLDLQPRSKKDKKITGKIHIKVVP